MMNCPFALRKGSTLENHRDPTEIVNYVPIIFVFQILKLKFSKLYSVILAHPKICHFFIKCKAYLCMVKIRQDND